MQSQTTLYLLYANPFDYKNHLDIFCKCSYSNKWLEMKKDKIGSLTFKGNQSLSEHYPYIYKLAIDFKNEPNNHFEIKGVSDKGINYFDVMEKMNVDGTCKIFLRFDLKFKHNHYSNWTSPPDMPIGKTSNQILCYIDYFLKKDTEMLREALKQMDNKISKLDSQAIANIFLDLIEFTEVCTVLLSLSSFKKTFNLNNFKPNLDQVKKIIEKISHLIQTEENFLEILTDSQNYLLTLLLTSDILKFSEFEKIYSKCIIKNIEEYLLDENVKSCISFKNSVPFKEFLQILDKNMLKETILDIYFSFNPNINDNLAILSDNIKEIPENISEQLLEALFAKREFRFLSSQNQKAQIIQIFQNLNKLKKFINSDSIPKIFNKILNELDDLPPLLIFKAEHEKFNLSYENQDFFLKRIKDKYREIVISLCNKSLKCLFDEDFNNNFIKSIYKEKESFRRDLLSKVEALLQKDHKLYEKERQSIINLLLNKDLAFILLTKGEIIKVVLGLLTTEDSILWFIKEFLQAKSFPEQYFSQNIKIALINLMKLCKDGKQKIVFAKKHIDSLGINRDKFDLNEFVLLHIYDNNLNPELFFSNIGKYNKDNDVNFINAVCEFIQKKFTKLKTEAVSIYVKKLFDSKDNEIPKNPTEIQFGVVAKILDGSPNLVIEENEFFQENSYEKLKLFAILSSLPKKRKDLREKNDYFKKTIEIIKIMQNKILNEEITYKNCQELHSIQVKNSIIFEQKLKILNFDGSKNDLETLKKKTNDILKKYQNFREGLLNYNILLMKYLTFCKESAQLSTDYHNLTTNIQETKVKDLKFLANIESLQEISSFIGEVDKSLIFQSIFFEKRKNLSPNSVEIGEMLKVLEETKKEFENKIMNLCDPKKTTLKQLDIFRGHEKEAQKELEEFGKMFKLSNAQQQGIINSLKNLEKVNNFLEIIESFLQISQHLQIEKGEMWNKLEKGKQLLQNDLLLLKEFTEKFPDLENFIKKKFKKIEEKAKNERFLSVFKEIARNINLIKFVQDKKSEDLRQLIENNENLEDELFKIESVISLIKVHKFVQEIQESLQKKRSEDVFMNSIVDLLTKRPDNLFEKLDTDLYLASNSLSQIVQRFQQQRMDKAEANKTKILKLLEKSSLKIIRPKDENVYTIEISIKNAVLEKISYNDLIEMRDISLLYTQNSLSTKVFENNKKAEDISLKFVFFKEVVDCVQNLLDLLREILETGYSMFQEINLEIFYEPQVKQKLEELVEYYRKVYEKWIEKLHSFYSDSFINCLLYGKHFEYLYLETTKKENSQIQTNFICSYVEDDMKISTLAQKFFQINENISFLDFIDQAKLILQLNKEKLLKNYKENQFSK